MKRLIFITTFFLLLSSITKATPVCIQNKLPVIPLPNEYYQTKGEYVFPSINKFSIRGGDVSVLDLKEYIKSSPFKKLQGKGNTSFKSASRLGLYHL